MAQPLQRGRHQEPAKLPWLGTRPRSLGPTTRPAKLDRRRYRKRTIPTDKAIRAAHFLYNNQKACYTLTWSSDRPDSRPERGKTKLKTNVGRPRTEGSEGEKIFV